MTETAGMRALLDLEDAAPDVLLETVAGTRVQLWPLARWPVSRAIAEADIGTALPNYARGPLRQRVTRAVRRGIPNPHSSRRAPQAVHLFIVSGWTKAAGTNGFVNWLSDDFAAALGSKAVVVQDAFLDRLSRGDQRPALADRTFSDARELERVTERARRNPLPDRERRRLATAMAEVFRVLPFAVDDAARARAIDDALGRAERAPHAERSFSRLLDRVRPSMIHMQTAAYGPRSNLIRLAHERGIRVTELQHGWIGSSHAAYNFGAAMRLPPLVDALPDTLLTFGEQWGEGIRFPGRVVAIGKPSLDRVRNHAPAFQDRPKRVLFVGGNFEHERVDRVMIALRDALPRDWTVVYRPHPVERATVAQTHSALVGEPGIEFDPIADPGASLLASRAVVGFSSTMLFEALAYGCHVAVVESVLAEHYADAETFPLRIDDTASVGTVAAEFADAPAPRERAFADRVWRPGAVENFLRFVESS